MRKFVYLNPTSNRRFPTTATITGRRRRSPAAPTASPQTQLRTIETRSTTT